MFGCALLKSVVGCVECSEVTEVAVSPPALCLLWAPALCCCDPLCFHSRSACVNSYISAPAQPSSFTCPLSPPALIMCSILCALTWEVTSVLLTHTSKLRKVRCPCGRHYRLLWFGEEWPHPWTSPCFSHLQQGDKQFRPWSRHEFLVYFHDVMHFQNMQGKKCTVDWMRKVGTGYQNSYWLVLCNSLCGPM